MKHVAVYGIYLTQRAAERAVTELKSEGIDSSDVSVLFESSTTTKAFAHENGSKASEGEATGSLSGATLGGVLGWLAGMGTLTIPGVRPLIAAGPLMAMLAGAGTGGRGGGITGALIGFGIPEDEAKRFERRISDGGILLSVHTESEEDGTKARKVLERTEATDISQKLEDKEISRNLATCAKNVQ